MNTQRGRTPLHYAAVLPDAGDLYKELVAVGADEKAADMVSLPFLSIRIDILFNNTNR